MGWMDWICSLRGLAVRFDEPLAAHTSLGVGGAAEAYVEPLDVAALASLWKGLVSRRVPRFLLGAGTNVIFPDSGFEGAVVRLGARLGGARVAPGRNGAGAVLAAGAGTTLGRLLRTARDAGLGGAEFLAGIPGTVGGACAMNAGAAGGSVSSVMTAVRLIDSAGRLEQVDASRLRFGYRSACLPKDSVVTEAVFRLRRAPFEKIEAEIEANLAIRREKQPVRARSAGCVFRNPPGGYAGMLIEAAGLKGEREGGAYVSRKHANFILNDGTATAADVFALIERIRERVELSSGVRLELEVKTVGLEGCPKELS